MKLRDGDQPLPVPNEARDVQSQVIDDIVARRQVGIERYGTALQPYNGRDALRDAYEEAIDLSMYLKQLILERDAAGAAQSPSPAEEAVQRIEALAEEWEKARDHHEAPIVELARELRAALASPAPAPQVQVRGGYPPLGHPKGLPW